MIENIVELFKLLPLPWIVCVLSWLACGYTCKTFWQRGNDLQDKNLETVKDYAQKLSDLNMKMTDTLNALIASMHKGGKR